MPTTEKGKGLNNECRRCKMPKGLVLSEKLKCHADGRLTYQKGKRRIKYQHIWLY